MRGGNPLALQGLRRKGGGLFSLAAVALGIVGCRSTSPLNPREAEGRRLYEVRCAHCHQYNDLELKKAPPDLHGVFRQASLPSGVSATDDEVRRVVLSGKGMMPSFAGRFTQDQMAALLAYLHTGLR